MKIALIDSMNPKGLAMYETLLSFGGVFWIASPHKKRGVRNDATFRSSD